MNMNGTYKRKQNMQNGTISELYTDGKKPYSKPNGILKSVKSVIQKRRTYKTIIAELFSKTYNKKKISNKRFHHCEAKIFLEKVTNKY